MTYREIALERFEKLHPPHANPAAGGEPYDAKSYQKVEGGSVDVACGCGYRASFSASVMGRDPKGPDNRPSDVPTFQSSRKEYKGPSRP